VKRSRSLIVAAAVMCGLMISSCGKKSADEPGGPNGDNGIPATPATAIPGHEALQDNSPKEGPRLLPAEVYLRSYARLFGDYTPEQVEAIGRGSAPGVLFDRWRDYLASLGLPDYREDVNRGVATNSLMVATFDRLGIALCIRAVERELRGAVPIEQRRVFAFESPDRALSDEEFNERFDVLHRTFLGYPANLAETDRIRRFRELYRMAIAEATSNSVPRLLTPKEIGWAAVCYGLSRHPELHLY
jgi:hypothetical protein